MYYIVYEGYTLAYSKVFKRSTKFVFGFRAVTYVCVLCTQCSAGVQVIWDVQVLQLVHMDCGQFPALR